MRGPIPARLLGLAFAACLPAIASPATLNGRITAPGGAGVNPLDIDVRDNNTQLLLLTPGDTTDVNGNHSIVLPSGRYDVTHRPAAGSHLFRKTRSGILVSSVTKLNRTLVAGRYLTGRWVGTSGTGVPGASIGFHDAATGAAPALVHDDVTDGLGFFNTRVSPGTYDVEILPPRASRKVPQGLPGLALATVERSLGARTLASGFLIVRGPTPAFANLSLAGFRPLGDTTLNLVMSHDNALGVGPPAAGGALELSLPWPNPARGGASTAIVASVPSDVELTVLDLAGRRVAVIR